jgi:hypothetical protein
LSTRVAQTRLRDVTDRSFVNGVRVDQASGMVSIQAHCSFTEAVILMRNRADETNRSIDEIADLVLNRRIRFGD